VLPMVARLQKSFHAWAQPGFEPFRFDYNADRLEALAEERALEWERVGKAVFLTVDERREAVGYGPAPKDAAPAYDKRAGIALERRYSSDQPRVGAGSAEGGQWTSGGGGGGGSTSDDVALNLDRDLAGAVGSAITRIQESVFDVDLTEDEGGFHDGHAIRDHVGKTDANLSERSVRNRIRIGRRGYWKPGIGSFQSLTAANKLVNSSLSQNRWLVDEVVAGKRLGATLEAWFKAPTGKEAYAPKFSSSVEIRDTFGVRILIRRDRSSRRGFRIFTAFPINPD